MKKDYIQPEMLMVKLHSQAHILTGSVIVPVTDDPIPTPTDIGFVKPDIPGIIWDQFEILQP